MLARYLRTSQQPIRYAMDPAHAAAIRNYLALTTRAYDVPGLYQQARPHLPGGREGELLHHLFSAMIGEHDPDALALFLDAHQDMTGQPTPQTAARPLVSMQPHLDLLSFVAGLHRAASGTGSPTSHPTIFRPVAGRFAPGRLDDPLLRRRVQDAYHEERYGSHVGHGTLPRDVAYIATALMRPQSLGLPDLPEHLDRLDILRDFDLPEGHPRHLVQLHDLLRELGGRSDVDPLQGHLKDARVKTSAILRNTAIPQLLHHG